MQLTCSHGVKIRYLLIEAMFDFRIITASELTPGLLDALKELSTEVMPVSRLSQRIDALQDAHVVALCMHKQLGTVYGFYAAWTDENVTVLHSLRVKNISNAADIAHGLLDTLMHHFGTSRVLVPIGQGGNSQDHLLDLNEEHYCLKRIDRIAIGVPIQNSNNTYPHHDMTFMIATSEDTQDIFAYCKTIPTVLFRQTHWKCLSQNALATLILEERIWVLRKNGTVAGIMILEELKDYRTRESKKPTTYSLDVTIHSSEPVQFALAELLTAFNKPFTCVRCMASFEHDYADIFKSNLTSRFVYVYERV